MVIRIKATDDDLKRAYRKIVLIHHPDKRKAKGEEVKTDDDYFTCITRAYEILGNPTKRRAFDSVDPEFDDGLPSSSTIEKDYYGTFKKYFALNARWSEKKRIPEFGDDNSTRDDVEKFYNFWYNFESWREFSYLDEEDKEKGADRDERRWIEKQNKSIRAKRKKDEMSRIRSLVDLAYNKDPRITKFKQEEKDKRNAQKRAKQDAFQQAKAAEEQAIRDVAMAKKAAEEAEQKRIEKVRMEREREKKLIKKEKKLLRDHAKSVNYFTEPTAKDLVKNMEGVEKICDMLKLVELQDVNKRIQAASGNGKGVFKDTLRMLDERLEEERQQHITKTNPAAATNNTTTTTTAVKAVDKSVMWNADNMQLLIKAVNLFPAGTVQRWDVIANYMNQHSKTAEEAKYNSRDVLSKAKDFNQDFNKSTMKTQANENAFESFEKQRKDAKKVDPEDISVSSEVTEAKKKEAAPVKKETVKEAAKPKAAAPAPAAAAPMVNGKGPAKEKENKPANKPEEKVAAPVKVEPTPVPEATTPAESTEAKGTWSKEEQALLEQAIKTYPISTADRWERIAECIPNRTKKDCLRRVKELVDLVNAKKEAQKVK